MNMNKRNEDGWDECDEPDGCRKMDELADFATGVLVGLIAGCAAYLIAFNV